MTRLWLSCWLLSLVCGGCTLAFDTDTVEFEPSSSDAGRDLASDIDGGDDAGPKPVAGLGELCGIETPTCVPEDDFNWPDCADAQCQRILGTSARCMLGSSPYGYCSRPCRVDSECQGDLRDVFSASMRCVTADNGEGFCLPGSQEPCVLDGLCPVGEACKLTRTVLAGGEGLSVVCQTETRGGVAPGQPCVDDPRRSRNGVVRFCSNDFCFDDVCSSFCDLASGDVDCGNPDLDCRRDYLDILDYSTVRRTPPEAAGLCLPTTCASPAECVGNRAVCTPGLTFRDSPVRKDGLCRADSPDSEGSQGLGDPCEDGGSPAALECGSRFCAGFPPNFYCSGLCDRDADCGVGQLCAIDRLVDSLGPFFSRICRYAPGSQTRCDRTVDPACPVGEVCAPYVFGSVSQDGRKVAGGSIEGRCVSPVQGGVRSGNACGEQECVAPDACVRFPGEDTAQCVTVCGGGHHCENEIDVCLAEAIFVRAGETVEDQDLVLGICSL
jgi:hypothetical protein